MPSQCLVMETMLKMPMKGKENRKVYKIICILNSMYSSGCPSQKRHREGHNRYDFFIPYSA